MTYYKHTSALIGGNWSKVLAVLRKGEVTAKLLTIQAVGLIDHKFLLPGKAPERNKFKVCLQRQDHGPGILSLQMFWSPKRVMEVAESHWIKKIRVYWVPDYNCGDNLWPAFRNQPIKKKKSANSSLHVSILRRIKITKETPKK